MDFRTLWRRAAAGDEEAAQQLLEPLRRSIVGLVRRKLWGYSGDSEAWEDVVQAILVTAYRKVGQWRPNSARPAVELPDEELWRLLRGWVYGIATRTAAHTAAHRPLSTTRRVPDTVISLEAGAQEQVGLIDPEPGPAYSIPEKLDRQRQWSAIMACLPRLTPLQRTVLELTYFVGLHDEEIADQLSMTENAVRQRRRDAVRAVRRLLRAAEGTDPELVAELPPEQPTPKRKERGNRDRDDDDPTADGGGGGGDDTGGLAMRDDEDMDRTLRQLVAATEAAGERAELESQVGLRLGQGVWAEGLCLDAEGNTTRHLWFRLLRRLLPSGKLRITLQGPELARDAFIGRLVLEGRTENGAAHHVAIPIGDMQGREATVDVPESAVQAAPIPLATAVPHCVELRLLPWAEKVAAQAQETLQSMIHALASLPQAFLEPQAPLATASDLGGCGLAAGTLAEVEEVVELGPGLRAVFKHAANDEVLLSLEADDRSQVGGIVRFAVDDVLECTTIAEGYAELQGSPFVTGGSAQFSLGAVADLPSDIELHAAILEDPVFTAEDVPLLTWSRDHARGRGQKAWATRMVRRVQGAR